MEQTPRTTPARTAEPAARIEAPKISLPKGGGAVRGIGETFRPDAFTGTGGFAVALPTAPARGLAPELTLSYNTGNGNGPFGLGFDLSLPTISRRTDKGFPTYVDEDDTFILAGADHLVPVLSPPTRATRDGAAWEVRAYRPRTEGAFHRIEHWKKDDGESFWEITTADGTIQTYGRSAGARLADPADPKDPGRVFRWSLEEVRDNLGNRALYQYKHEDAAGLPNTLSESGRVCTDLHLRRVLFGNWNDSNEAGTERFNFELVLDYGEYDAGDPDLHPDRPARPWPVRRDPFSSYRSGFEIRTRRLCRGALLFHCFDELGPEPVLVRALRLVYDEDEKLTRLRRVESMGFRRENGRVATQSLPPLELGYTEADPKGVRFKPLLIGGIDGRAPQGYEGGSWLPVDLYGEGIAGLLWADDHGVLYHEPLGNGRLRRPRQPKDQPLHKPMGTGAYALRDLDGDGCLDLVVQGGEVNGSYSIRHDRGWGPFKPFDASPLALADPAVELADLDADGRADLVLERESTRVVYRSRGREGYEKATTVARQKNEPMVRQGAVDEKLLFADLVGDGLDHRVRIRSGQVALWPNLGHGRFGNPVVLQGPVIESFDAGRVRLADVDGTGPLDLLYIHSDHVAVYPNLSGNGFGPPVKVPLPRRWNNLDQITFGDIEGDGTTCLVVTSNTPEVEHLYCPLTGGVKPHLLAQADNNMGAVTRIRYASSTRFYLADREAGRPWATRLPFPVHVVEKVESIDQISGSKLVTRFAYHHGHFDGHEREFRGFGMVEQWDTEAFEQFAVADLSDEPFEAGEKGLHALPAYTRTWFHTGALFSAERISRQYEREYDAGDPQARQLPDSSFESPVHPDALRDACRALHGQVLRSELYGLDGTDREKHPYTVSESRYVLRQVQPKANNRYASFQVLPAETLSYAYERNPADPRLSQSLVLAWDEYGFPLRSCEIAYPRRGSGHSPEQSAGKVVLSESRLLHETKRFYRLGVPAGSRGFELGGLHPRQDSLVTREEAAAHASAALRDVVPYEAELAGDRPQARLISEERLYYWNEAQTAPLPLGETTARALLHHAEAAEISQDGLAALFAEKIDRPALDALMRRTASDGGAWTDADGYWWNPGAVAFHHGADGYFLLEKTRDPFGAETRVRYDRYGLGALSVTDPLGLVTTAEMDYQALAPRRMTDINDNISEAGFDALGRVRLVSVRGTEEGAEKGDLPLANYRAVDPPGLEALLARPHDSLQGATSYLWDDLFAWRDRRQPPSVVTIARETHVCDLKPGEESRLQISLAFFDGFGRDLQTKTWVEDGKAWQLDDRRGLVEVESTNRWLTSGRTVYDNKGQPVKQYEPFYSTTPHYQSERALTEHGVTTVNHYDPLGRVYRVDLPKGYLSRIEIGTWEQRQFDANDTIEESPYFQRYKDRLDELSEDERDALKKAQAHAGTPTVQVLDALGRVYETWQYLAKDGKPLITHTELDVLGNTLRAADPRLHASGAAFNFVRRYSLSGAVLKDESADAGTSWSLHNAGGDPIRTWNPRGFVVCQHYDTLSRPERTVVQENGKAWEVVSAVYGESLPALAAAGLIASADPAQARARNFLGQMVIQRDGAGELVLPAFSFDGTPLEERRRLRRDWKNEADWSAPGGEPLEDEVFTFHRRFDALGRLIEEAAPDGGIVTRYYHRSGRLAGISHTRDGVTTPHVSDMAYNAKSQRERLRYVNGVETTYTYDPLTFELRTIQARRDSDGRTLQDIRYTYDPKGNITRRQDDSQKVVFGSNQQVDPLHDYHYDPLYRLIRATGREHSGQAERGAADPENNYLPLTLPSSEDGHGLRPYMQSYEYDDGGNLTRLRHAGTRAFTHEFAISARSNRSITRKDFPYGEVESYYDAAGNLLAMGHLLVIDWNRAGNIAACTLVQRQGAVSDREYYTYGAGGTRVRKVAEFLENGGSRKRFVEKIYIGSYIVSRARMDDGTPFNGRIERHLSDAGKCFMLLLNHRTGRQQGEPEHQEKYQLSDMLGSIALELNAEGMILTYEEYYPYGSTAFFAGRSLREVRTKELRFSAKELDTYTGLYYYGVRYYSATWIRWLSPDPAGTIDGLNRFAFVGGDPVNFRDVGGMMKELSGSCSPSPAAKESRVDPPSSTGMFAHGSISASNRARKALLYNPSPDDWRITRMKGGVQNWAINTAFDQSDRIIKMASGFASGLMDRFFDETLDRINPRYLMSIPKNPESAHKYLQQKWKSWTTLYRAYQDLKGVGKEKIRNALGVMNLGQQYWSKSAGPRHLGRALVDNAQGSIAGATGLALTTIGLMSLPGPRAKTRNAFESLFPQGRAGSRLARMFSVRLFLTKPIARIYGNPALVAASLLYLRLVDIGRNIEASETLKANYPKIGLNLQNRDLDISNAARHVSYLESVERTKPV